MLCYTGFMARDATPAYTDDLSRLSDVELYGMYEDETDPIVQQRLSDECKFRAQAFCMAQEAN